MELKKLHATLENDSHFEQNYEEALDEARDTVIQQLEVSSSNGRLETI